MLSFITASLALGAAVVSAQTTTVPHTSTDTAAVAAEKATDINLSPTSNVKGKAFDRFVTIMMENTDYSLASTDPNMKLLAAKGITLSNYYGITHPSEPNYLASYGGDSFGMDNDDFTQVPANVSNVWDLLAEKGISYSAYQQNLPYPGFEGYEYLDVNSGANNYVRKHNPPILFNGNTERFDFIKDFDAFQADVDANTLSQHIFLTPNMLNDAHDTQITYGADWLYTFLEPLLDNPAFMNNTLLLINFDETGTYPHSNEVFSILISDLFPSSLVNTTDDTVYTQYSQLSTVEANWDLSTLGRWDVGANVFKFVANLTGDVIREPEVPIGSFFFNQSYPGAFSIDADMWAPLPAPNTSLVVNGRKVFKDVVAQYADLQDCTYYDNVVLAADGLRLPKALPASCAAAVPKALATSTASSVHASTTGISWVTKTAWVTHTRSAAPTPSAPCGKEGW